MARLGWIAALAVLAGAIPGGAAGEQYWGLSWSQGSATLHRVDPVRLTPLGASLRLGNFNADTAWSPDVADLATGRVLGRPAEAAQPFQEVDTW